VTYDEFGRAQNLRDEKGRDGDRRGDRHSDR
jgi:hypothetical protein